MKNVSECCVVGLLSVSLMSLSGCAYFSKTASVQSAAASDGLPENAGRVAIPAFIQEKYKGGHGTERWPDAALTDRFATGLLQRGYTLVDRAVVQKTLKDNGLTWKDIHREEIVAQIGQLLKADVVVLGTLSLVEQADGTILSRKVNVRGIRVSDGQVVLSMSAVDATMYRVLSGEALVDQGLADMFSTSAEGNFGEGESPKRPAASVSPNTSASATLGGDAEVSAASPAESMTDEGGTTSDELEAEESVSEPSETSAAAASPDEEAAVPADEAGKVVGE